MNNVKNRMLISLGILLALLLPAGYAVFSINQNDDFQPLQEPEPEEWDHKMHYPQLPDPNGWDVFSLALYIEDIEDFNAFCTVADDWMCTESGFVTDITWWGSWMGDVEHDNQLGFYIGIWSDSPANETHHSRPDELLWDRFFTLDKIDIGEQPPSLQGWYDPDWPMYEIDDHFNYFRYELTNISEPFYQENNTIYWLSIIIVVDEPESVWGDWGWKTSLDHWNDYAVWGKETMGTMEWGWHNMSWHNLTDPVTSERLDLAFVIGGESLNYPPDAFDEDPTDLDTGISTMYDTVSVTIEDPEGDEFNVFIHGDYVINVSLYDQINGTFYADLTTPLPFETLITWHVDIQSNSSNIATWKNYTFSFTTESLPSIVYVNTTYDDSTPGWQYDRFDIIQDGIDGVAVNGTVYVHEGVYTENIVINKSLSLIGDGSANTIINPALTQGRTIDVEGDEHAYIAVTVTGFTLDHEHFNSTGNTVGLWARYIDGLHIEDIHAINFGNNNHATERGGFDIYNVKNIIVKDIIVDSVYGSFTKGMRLTHAENVYFENFDVSNTFGVVADSWMITMNNDVMNGTFNNLSYKNHLSGHALAPLYLGANTYNLTFNNVHIQNITTTGNSGMFIRMQFGSNNNTFNNLLFEDLTTTGLVASAIEITHETRDNTFNNVTIRNINGGTQTRAINLDRGAKYNTFNDVLIDGLNGYTSTNSFGITLNSRDGNTDTMGNSFNGVTIENINTTGNFFAMNVNSLAADYDTHENVFYGVYAEIKPTDTFSNSIGFRDISNSNNIIENSYISGFDTGLLLDADNTLVTGNYIINNTVGINVTSVGNLIYNNYFNNTVNAIDSTVPDVQEMERFLYYGGLSIISGNRVVKANLTDLSTEAESLNYGVVLYAITADDEYVYAGGDSPVELVHRYWKSNMTFKDQTPSYGGSIHAITVDGDYVYVGGSGDTVVRRYLRSNLSFVDESPSYGGSIDTIVIDGDYVYVGGVANMIRRYLKSNLSFVDESPSYGGRIYVILIDGDDIYAAGETETIKKYLKSNLSFVDETASYGSLIWALTMDDEYLYGGGDSIGRVYQYWKSNMTKKAEGIDSGRQIHELHADDVYVYSAEITVNPSMAGNVRRYWSSNMTLKDETPNYDAMNMGVLMAMYLDPMPEPAGDITNTWNISKILGTNIVGGPYLGGNYWHDYLGEDTTGDGLGDTLVPYNSNGNIQTGGDNLPLIPWPNEPPDIPVLVSPVNTSWGTVYVEYFNCTVFDPDEDDLTVYFYWGNGTLFGTVTNASNGPVSFDMKTISPIWWLDNDTTYTWYVVVDDGVEQQQSETWTYHTAVAWDLNLDRVIDALDVSGTVTAYGTSVLPGEIPADINDDGIVDALDVSLVISYYGTVYLS